MVNDKNISLHFPKIEMFLDVPKIRLVQMSLYFNLTYLLLINFLIFLKVKTLKHSRKAVEPNIIRSNGVVNRKREFAFLAKGEQGLRGLAVKHSRLLSLAGKLLRPY